jgi:starvation-inducible outer membrane lipoprotein
MKKLILILSITFLFAGCSIVPKDPRMSFGKKCMVDDQGNMVSSYVWIYSKSMQGETSLTATKELCDKLGYITTK